MDQRRGEFKSGFACATRKTKGKFFELRIWCLKVLRERERGERGYSRAGIGVVGMGAQNFADELFILLLLLFKSGIC